MKNFPYIDGDILEVASLTELPSQPVNMARAGFLGAQIQQLKVSAQPPVIDSAAPLVVTRRNLGNGNLQFRVQFIAPTRAQDPNYQSTSILLATPNGSTTVAAAGGKGPIVFNAPQTSAPSSAAVQQDNTNASSVTRLGSGSSRALVQQ